MAESTAAAVGATVLLGGFAMGIRGLIVGWPRKVLEARALNGSYLGGAAGLLGLIADITIRYL